MREVIKPLFSHKIFTVSSPPHWHCGRTIPGLMQYTLLALLPAAIMAVYRFGVDALQVMSLSCAVAVAVEALCCRMMGRESSVDDYSALVTGLLFAFLLPAAAPWWLVLIGSALSVGLGKMLFGGLGGAPLCPPLVGWAVCRISWRNAMDIDMTMLGVDLTYPLSQLKYLGLDQVSGMSGMQLFAGDQLGGLGAVQIWALLAGGLFLVFTGRLRPEIPAAFLAGTVFAALLFYLSDAGVYASPLFHLLTGSVVLGAFFLATDCSSSPVGRVPMLLFGLTAGVLVIIIRIYGVYPDGVPFAILLANLLTPLFDRIRPKPFGVKTSEGKAS